MSKLLGVVKNGNYFIQLYSDGTKIRQTTDTKFIPEYPECLDVTITKRCNGNCGWCYMGCNENGEYCTEDSFRWLINNVRPYMEIALNINDLSYPNLEGFLYSLNKKGAIVNLTINQKHLMNAKNMVKLTRWESVGLFKGIGISYEKMEEKFLDWVRIFKNPVIHVINGFFGSKDYADLKNEQLKLLILGYKRTGRGGNYLLNNNGTILKNQEWLEQNIANIFSDFKVVAFDNLAIEQLGIQEKIPKEEWNELYMGDEGEFTFYIDLVDRTYSRTSFDKEKFPLTGSIENMFTDIRMKYKL